MKGSAARLAMLLVACVMTPSQAIAGSHPRMTRPYDVRCEGGQALTIQPTTGLPLMVGACDAGRLPESRTLAAPAPAPPSPADCVVPTYDTRCETWIAPRYDDPWGGDDYPGYGSFERVETIVAHPTEDLLFVGGTYGYNSNGFDADFVDVAYQASTGKPVWNSSYTGNGARTLAYQSSIALSKDGQILFALGEIAEPSVYDYSAAIVAFDAATGRYLWDKVYDFGINSIVTAENEDHHQLLLAAGTSRVELPSGAEVPAGTTASIDPSNGDVRWISRVPGNSTHGSRFNELVASNDGHSMYAAGGEHRSDNLARNFLTAGFDTEDGDLLWSQAEERTRPEGAGNGNNGATDMAITPDGSRIVVTGFDPVSSNVIGTPSTSAILTVAYDTATGNKAWRQTYGGPVAGETHFYFNLFQGMLGISPDGHTVVATGAISSGPNTGTVAYDVENGNQLWGNESVEPGYVATNFLGYYPKVLVGDGNTFLTTKRGYGWGSYDTVTFAYGSTDGATEWTARYGNNRTLPCGSTLSADGSTLYVTMAEQVYSPGGLIPDPNLDSVDIVTVAYNT